MIAITAALLVAGIGIVPAQNQQAVVQQEPEIRQEWVGGYEVVGRAGERDVCLLIDGAEVWVTMDCEECPPVDWDGFDEMVTSLEG